MNLLQKISLSCLFMITGIAQASDFISVVEPSRLFKIMVPATAATVTVAADGTISISGGHLRCSFYSGDQISAENLILNIDDLAKEIGESFRLSVATDETISILSEHFPCSFYSGEDGETASLTGIVYPSSDGNSPAAQLLSDFTSPYLAFYYSINLRVCGTVSSVQKSQPTHDSEGFGWLLKKRLLRLATTSGGLPCSWESLIWNSSEILPVGPIRFRSKTYPAV